MDDQKKALLLDKLKKATPLLTALGDSVRQKIIFQLVEAGKNGLSVNEITAGQKLSRSTISHHLKTLKDSGLLAIRESGTFNYYYLDVTDALKEGMDLLNFINDCLDSQTK